MLVAQGVDSYMLLRDRDMRLWRDDRGNDWGYWCVDWEYADEWYYEEDEYGEGLHDPFERAEAMYKEQVFGGLK